MAASNPDIVYIGMGETELRGSIMQGDGVYKSTDAGKTWHHIGLADTQAISRIRVDPKNPDLVYVAALGHPYGPNPDRGVFRSTDGGQTWKRMLFRDERAGAADLVLDPHNPKVLFASLWQVQRTPWNLSSGGESSGFFKSTDGGDTWTEITREPGLPKGIIGKITVAVSPADSNRVYAMVEAADGGLFRSDDAGQTWTLINEDHAIRQRAFYFSRLTADPQKRDTVWIMNVEIYRSDDGGKTLLHQRTAHADHHDLWIAPDDSRRMAASDDGGGCISVDGGKTWSRENFPTAQFYHVATTAEFPYDVVGAQQDSGTAAVPTERAPYRHEPALPHGRVDVSSRWGRGRLYSPRSEKSRHHLRRRPGRHCGPVGPSHGHQPGGQRLPVVLFRHVGRRAAGPLAVDVPHRVLAGGHQHAIYFLAASLQKHV